MLRRWVAVNGCLIFGLLITTLNFPLPTSESFLRPVSQFRNYFTLVYTSKIKVTLFLTLIKWCEFLSRRSHLVSHNPSRDFARTSSASTFISQHSVCNFICQSCCNKKRGLSVTVRLRMMIANIRSMFLPASNHAFHWYALRCCRVRACGLALPTRGWVWGPERR